MREKDLEPLKFSEHFKLDQNIEFDFVDIYAHQDLPVFLDPYGLSSMRTKWAEDCENEIATYFQYLIDSINNGDKKTTKRLLNALHEVNEISLGYSSGLPKGRGIGTIQGNQIQESFERSQAVKSGDIRDIADCAILIPGISRDKISDITANILKRRLVTYTQEQCKKYEIPTKRVAVNNAFDFETFEFTSYFAQLPVINNRAKILLPAGSVRQDPLLSKDKYYRNFVIEFLRAEHHRAGDSLATVLKNGKVVVRIGDLKERYPLSTDFLYDFSKEHPEILENYKSQLRTSARSNIKPRLKPKRRVFKSGDRKKTLDAIKPGGVEANKFHKFAFINLIHILGSRVSNPRMEDEVNEGRKRIDIVFKNEDQSGFFHSLNTKHQIKCPKIIVECKNYGNEIGNPELDQINGRLNGRRGRFGILVCRSIKDKKSLIARCKDLLNDNENYIIVLHDKDIVELLRFRDSNNEKAIDQYLDSKVDELIM